MPEASLQTILEENPDSESQGSTEIVTETAAIQPRFPPFHGGRIFNVSINNPPRDGETDEDRTTRVNRNANHAPPIDATLDNKIGVKQSKKAKSSRFLIKYCYYTSRYIRMST